MNITNNPADDILPKWSLGGSHVVFGSDRENEDSVFDLYQLNILTGTVQKLADMGLSSYYFVADYFTISEDGENIFYSPKSIDLKNEIHKIDLISNEDFLIYSQEGGVHDLSNFDINTNQNKIIFDHVSVMADIGIINTDGSNIILYDLDKEPAGDTDLASWISKKYGTFHPADTAYSPRWDNNGHSFYYIDPTGFIISDNFVYYVSLSEYDLQRNAEKEIFRFPESAFNTGDNYPPKLHTVPNSERLIIQDGYDLFSFEKSTHEYSLITNGANPSFSNDGSKMIFERGGEVYSINLDGTGEIHLTEGNGENLSPVWQPIFTETPISDQIDYLGDTGSIQGSNI